MNTSDQHAFAASLSDQEVRAVLRDPKHRKSVMRFPLPDHGVSDNHMSRAQVGDLLYVKESWVVGALDEKLYRASFLGAEKIPPRRFRKDSRDKQWRSSWSMPRSQSRLTLQVTASYRKRLHDMTVEDVRREGVIVQLPEGYALDDPQCVKMALARFQEFWLSLHGRESWSGNPWVRVLEFQTYECNVDEWLVGAQHVKRYNT